MCIPHTIGVPLGRRASSPGANRPDLGGEITPTQREPHDSVISTPVADPDVLIRKVRASDLETLAALDGTFGALKYPDFVLRQLFDVHQDCWLVAEHAAGLLGYALSAPCTDRSTGWLLGHVVGSDYRRRGYGRLLALSALQILRSIGARRVYLTVEPANDPAIKLYENLGFIRISSDPNYLGPGKRRILMELNF